VRIGKRLEFDDAIAKRVNCFKRQLCFNYTLIVAVRVDNAAKRRKVNSAQIANTATEAFVILFPLIVVHPVSSAAISASARSIPQKWFAEHGATIVGEHML
jgi:hypothetical protein